MAALRLYGYFYGVVPTWSLCMTKTPDEAELVLLPPEAVAIPERDGVQCGAKFYTARNVHMLASCSLRGFRLLSQQSISQWTPSQSNSQHTNSQHLNGTQVLECDGTAQEHIDTWLLDGRYQPTDRPPQSSSAQIFAV
jgi:hypothetical protein